MTLATPSDNDCASNTTKLNEGAWKGEYCGYAAANATTKTPIKEFAAAKGGKACNLLKPNSTEQPVDPMAFEY